MAILISDKTDCKTKNVTGDEEVHIVMKNVNS